MKRRILSILMAVLMLAACFAPAALAEMKNAWVKMPNAGGSLNLRVWPGKNFESIGYVKDGDSIQVYVGQIGTDNEGEEWTRILANSSGKTGYIKTKYVSYTQPTAGSTSSGSTGTTATVWVSSSGGSLKVRSGPSTDFARAGYVKHGDRVTILEKGGEWSKIKVNATGVTGYLKTKYLTNGSTGSSSGGSSAPSTGTSAPTGSDYDLAAVMTKTFFGTVNLRTGPGTNYGSVAKLPRGTKLAVYGSSGNWYQVRTLDGKTGYISKNYVAFGVPAQVTAGVNFRKGPGTGYSVIRTLANGTAVSAHSVNGKWVKVTHGSNTGYVHISYLKLK